MRVDVVLDQYSNESIKLQSRKNRENGVKCKVVLNGEISKNWKGFLRNLGNKEELFQLLADSILNVEKGLVYATLGNSTVCKRIQRKPICCNHEEGDTKIFVHLKHAIENDLIGTASIQAYYTDIVILSLAFFFDFPFLSRS